MSRFNPLLRHTCVLVFSFVGLWLILALFFAFLPEGWDAEPSRDIAAGQTVTRAYSVDQWFPFYDSKENVKTVKKLGREFFAIDVQVKYSSDSSTARFIIDKDHQIDLTSEWNRVDPETRPAGAEIATVVSETYYLPAKLGDRDGINLPWFRQADACLLFWEIHHDSVKIPVRFRVVNWTMQIWPDSDSWELNNLPRVGEPLVELYKPDGAKGSKVEARFPATDKIKNTSPSQSFVLRKAIQSVLVPTGLFVFNRLSFASVGLSLLSDVLDIIFKLLAMYVSVVLVCWLANGKPRFAPWAQSYWMTRHVVAKLPTLNQDPSAWHSPETDEADTKRRPQPLRGPGDFFRSTNPLDDFFVTFELTKGMVKPISFGRGRADSLEQAQVTGVPNDFRFNVSQRSSQHEKKAQQKDQADLEKGIR